MENLSTDYSYTAETCRSPSDDENLTSLPSLNSHLSECGNETNSTVTLTTTVNHHSTKC